MSDWSFKLDFNGTVSALRFFFTVTLGRADVARSLTFMAEPRKIPVVLSPEEVAPEDIADAVGYFMSEEASFTTGQHLFVCRQGSGRPHGATSSRPFTTCSVA